MLGHNISEAGRCEPSDNTVMTEWLESSLNDSIGQRSRARVGHGREQGVGMRSGDTG